MDLTKLHSELLAYIDKDAEAYGEVLAAYKLPNFTLEEADQRQNEIQATALTSIEVPLKIGEACIVALESGIMLLPKIKHGVLGDLKIGLLVMKAVVEGSLVTAKINLQLLKKDTLKTVLQVRIDELQEKFDRVITGLR
jgi:formiminotetrahydrofolate cyclodeaminase